MREALKHGVRSLHRASLLVLLAAAAPGAATAEQGVTLDVQPPSVDASPWYQRVQVRLILRNTGTVELVRPRLEAFTNDSFDVRIGPPSASRALPFEGVVWSAWIEGIGRARVPGTVQFQVTYSIAGRPGVQQAYATLAIKPTNQADRPLEIAIHGSFDAITEVQPGIGHLTVKNNLDVPVVISRIAILPPDAESFGVPPAVAPFSVPPRSTETRRIELTAAPKVRPGKHVVLFQSTAEWDEAGHHQTRTVTLDKEVSVGVVFESDLLKAIGVPSFLLLPGCLFLFTMQLLLALGVLGLNRHSKVPELPVTSPGFWVVAIMISGVFAFGYPVVTGTDYLFRYGARDLLNVWLSSIAAGALTYLIIGFLTMRRRRRRVPDARDSPIATLEKMARRGLGAEANRVRFRMNNLDFAAFLIERLEDGQTMIWVAPRIAITFQDTTEGRKLHGEVMDLLNQKRGLADIAQAVHDGSAHAAVDWDRQNSVPNPYHLKVEAITQVEGSERIVETR